jgi:hypothetical protein
MCDAALSRNYPTSHHDVESAKPVATHELEELENGFLASAIAMS